MNRLTPCVLPDVDVTGDSAETVAQEKRATWKQAEGSPLPLGEGKAIHSWKPRVEIPGKRCAGIRVIKETGRPIDAFDAIGQEPTALRSIGRRESTASPSFA